MSKRQLDAVCDEYVEEVLSIWEDFPEGPESVYGVVGWLAVAEAAREEYLNDEDLTYDYTLDYV